MTDSILINHRRNRSHMGLSRSFLSRSNSSLHQENADHASKIQYLTHRVRDLEKII